MIPMDAACYQLVHQHSLNNVTEKRGRHKTTEAAPRSLFSSSNNTTQVHIHVNDASFQRESNSSKRVTVAGSFPPERTNRFKIDTAPLSLMKQLCLRTFK